MILEKQRCAPTVACASTAVSPLLLISGPANQYLPCASVFWRAIMLLQSSTPLLPQDGGRMNKQFLCNIRKKRNGLPNVGGVFIRTRNVAPSRKECVVNGLMTKTSNKRVRPPSHCPPRQLRPVLPSTCFPSPLAVTTSSATGRGRRSGRFVRPKDSK